MEELDKVFDDMKKQLDNRLKNYVSIILDGSGSMTTIKDEAIQVFNGQLKTLRENKGEMETYLSVITFGTEVNKPIVWCGNVDDIIEIDEKQYVPNGLTALYDAVGTTIVELKKDVDVNDENTSFLMIIITDGYENNSKIFNSEKLSELIQDCQKTNRWTFTYLGSNQDLSIIKETLHIPDGNIASFVSDGGGTIDAMNMTYCSTAGYMNVRSSGGTSMTDFYKSTDGNAAIKQKRTRSKRNN